MLEAIFPDKPYAEDEPAADILRLAEKMFKNWTDILVGAGLSERDARQLILETLASV